MADGSRSLLFEYLDQLSNDDEANHRPRSWITATCPKCGREARRRNQPTQQGVVYWLCLQCGLLDAPIKESE
jgi:predicted RNA-binding Zn-ribbon protein involved in translation (DUF1610 family)